MTYSTPHGERRTYLKGCRCDPCKRAHSRYCKQQRLRADRGIPARVPVARALARLNELNTQGFSDGAIGAAAGLSSATVWKIRNLGGQVSVATMRALDAVEEVDSGLVPGDLTRLRVRSLMRAGWPLADIERHAAVACLEGGRWRYTEKVAARVAAGVRDAYAYLQDRPGPSRQTAGMAAANGYPRPVEWDDPGTLAWGDVEPWTPERRGFRLRGGRRGAYKWDEARWADVEHLRSFGVPDEQIAERFGIKPGTLEKAERRAGRRTSETPAA